MNMNRRPGRLLAALTFCFGLLAGTPAAHAEIKVDISVWPGWVAWYVAEQQGYFKKYDAGVKMVWFANYTDSISALSAGQLDANSQTWSDTLAPLAQEIPLKAMLVNDNSTGNDALGVGPNIKRFADLKGKTIALEEFSVSHFMRVTASQKNDMSIKGVEVVNLAAEVAKR